MEVPCGARLMKIIAIQVNVKVGSVKLPNGHYTQTGSKALEELSNEESTLQTKTD
jgi:hypothetical protein